MLRLITRYQFPSSPWRYLTLSLAVCCALQTTVGNHLIAIAQVPPALTLSESATPTSKKEPDLSLKEWRNDVEKRLSEAEALATEAKQAEKKPAPALERQLEMLARIDLILAQLTDEQEETQKLETKRQKFKDDLDQLVQHDFSEDESATFKQLDLVREELLTEERRLNRIVDKEKSAITSLEKAQEDLNKKNAERRSAKERSEDNRDDNLRRNLGERLAESIERSELAKAVARLRRQEVINAKAAREIQELQVRILKEKESRLKVVVKFGPQELSNLFEEIDQHEDDLKSRVTKFESAAEPRIRYVEDQWISARRQFDATTGEKAELREKINAFELEYQVLKEIPPLLRLQLDLLNRDRQVWRYRQRVFSGRPDRETVREWVEESTDALAQIKREERKALFEIDELREQLQVVEERKKVELKSLEAEAIEKQLGSLRSLLNFQEESLSSIRTSIWLHERLLNELEGGSLAATAKDQLHNLWGGVLALWNYELTSFGDKENERSVTIQKVVTALLILLAGIVFSRALSRALGRQVLRRLDIDPSASATIQSLFYYMLLLLFGLFALNIAKVPLTAFTVLGGAVALGIGFGSQNIINNFISGLILLAERPVKVGDLIQLDNVQSEPLYGNIEHIGARSTRVRTGNNLEIIVPNSSFLQNNVINFTLSSDKVRTRVEVGVAYGSPTVTVTQLLRRAVIETGRVAKDPPPIVLFKSFGDNALVFEVYFWLRMRTMMDQLQIESAVRFRIDQLFREEDITIAFPQRDVHVDTHSPLKVQMVESTSDTQTD